MSSKLKHGKTVVESNGNFYRLNYDKSKIFKTNKEGVFDYDKDNKILNYAPLDFSITKNISTIILVAFIMFFYLQIWQNLLLKIKEYQRE